MDRGLRSNIANQHPTLLVILKKELHPDFCSQCAYSMAASDEQSDTRQGLRRTSLLYHGLLACVILVGALIFSHGREQIRFRAVVIIVCLRRLGAGGRETLNFEFKTDTCKAPVTTLLQVKSNGM